MRIKTLLSGAGVALLVLQGCAPTTTDDSPKLLNANKPDLLNTQWHVHQCRKLPDSISAPVRACNHSKEPQRDSWFRIDPIGSGNDATLVMKLANNPKTFRFEASLQAVEQKDAWVTGYHIPFVDTGNSTHGVDKVLHLYIARTRASNDIHNSTCRDRLEQKSFGSNVFPTKEVCEEDRPNHRFRNAIYWRIQSRDEGAAYPEEPPDDGQGTGSDDPP